MPEKLYHECRELISQSRETLNDLTEWGFETVVSEDLQKLPICPLGPSRESAGTAVCRPETLDELGARLQDCILCPLCEKRNKVVFGVGNSQADLVLVGEAAHDGRIVAANERHMDIIADHDVINQRPVAGADVRERIVGVVIGGEREQIRRIGQSADHVCVQRLAQVTAEHDRQFFGYADVGNHLGQYLGGKATAGFALWITEGFEV